MGLRADIGEREQRGQYEWLRCNVNVRHTCGDTHTASIQGDGWMPSWENVVMGGCRHRSPSEFKHAGMRRAVSVPTGCVHRKWSSKSGLAELCSERIGMAALLSKYRIAALIDPRPEARTSEVTCVAFGAIR